MKNHKGDKMTEKGKPVLVTTAHHGVFFGYLVGEPSKERVILLHGRNCLYWSTDERGFLGLAESGPSDKCRVGPAAVDITLYDITSVTTCTAKAVEAWEAAPWAK
jgi:hypothetical protein